jgi:hypothetical protein
VEYKSTVGKGEHKVWGGLFFLFDVKNSSKGGNKR